MRPVKLFFLSLCVSLNCFSVDARTLLNAVETGDITSVMQLFDEMQALSTEHSLA